MKGRTYRYMTESPLYSFGHGLSYTNFTYGPATLSQQTISQGKEVTLTIPVQNTGNYDGEEVVQVIFKVAREIRRSFTYTPRLQTRPHCKRTAR